MMGREGDAMGRDALRMWFGEGLVLSSRSLTVLLCQVYTEAELWSALLASVREGIVDFRFLLQ